MPAPTAEALAATAKQYFSAQGIALPMKWRAMGPLYPDAFGPPELATPANPPTTLYHEPTGNRYHTGAARSLSREYEKFIDGISTALADAIAKWMQIASVVSVNVVGPVGTLLPGGVSGPALYPLIMAVAPQETAGDRKYARAIAAAISDNWYAWQQGLSGVLNYPGFSGAPMANTPAPLITLASEPEPGLAQHNLSSVMQRNLNDKSALHASTLFASVANAFFTHFQVFKTNTLVTGVTVAAAAPLPAEAPGAGAAPNSDAAQTEPAANNEEKNIAQEDQEPEEIEPEQAPAPSLAGMVIPTPGNFI